MSGLSSFGSKSSLVKIGSSKMKPFRIMVLGQSGCGKSAMVVRFITCRFIGDYDSTERVYTFSTTVDNETVNFEILDAAGQMENECLINALETNIRWAEAFILMYSVTDKCSFEEVNRLKFLINYNKRRKKICKDDFMDGVPVILVANKTDQLEDRMVTREEGHKRSKDIGCACFHEISVRESIDEVKGVFRDICRFWHSNLKRTKSDNTSMYSCMSMTLHSFVNPEKIISICCDIQEEKRRSILLFGRSKSAWHDDEERDDFDESDSSLNTNEPFRCRAKTDGNLISRPRRWKLPSPMLSPPVMQSLPTYISKRRNSISMRGHVSY